MHKTSLHLALATLLAATSLLVSARTAPTLAPVDQEPSTVVARRGADDGAGDSRRGRGSDDGANHARRGADDGAGHNRRGRGSDDGANHT